ncbi:Chloroperoxidase [Schizophyllum fasciatum]
MPRLEFIINCIKTLLWDIYLTLANKLSRDSPPGHVVAAHAPGAGGRWPEYRPPGPGDSRSACPALNALANHGILPRDGKNIPFPAMVASIHETYNFSASFAYFASNYAAHMLGRSYARDTLDLADLSMHNGIEHDASLTRLDTALAPDQSTPHAPFVRELLAAASGRDAATGATSATSGKPDAATGAASAQDEAASIQDGAPSGAPRLTLDDIARMCARRRVQARAANPAYSLAKVHAVFSVANSTTCVQIFGGKVDDLAAMFLEERIADGFESSTRARHGLTILAYQPLLKRVARGIEAAMGEEGEREAAREGQKEAEGEKEAV